MSNPWESIDLSDYESHMSLDGVGQLQALNALMREQLFSREVKSVMILGVAGGNGLEHIKSGDFERVYGVDINPEYLAECENLNDFMRGLGYIQNSQTETELPNGKRLIKTDHSLV